MTYRTEYTLGFLALLPLLATGVAKGTGWLVTIVVVYVGVPLLIWSLLVDRLASAVLRIICRLRESSGHQYYFERQVGKPGISRRLLRDIRVLVFVFFLSALIVPQVTQVNPQNLVIVSNAFIYVAIFLLAIPSSIHVLLWVLEDSGLRCHNTTRLTVTVPAAWASRWLSSLGGIGAFISFAIAMGGSLDRAISLGFTLMISLLPSCILAPTLFYRRLEPGIIAKIRQSKAAITMARLFPQVSGPSLPSSSAPTLRSVRVSEDTKQTAEPHS
ncbi:MAG: hypothetical protein AUF79_04010 [Crenarchaeota archaeon 13_1_20CM_2_51_8]|nr:MAG: hypothetical protein AUF79_04010 [Crenarchaeota archaeon 13_1_20CM_2_51_8]